MVVSYIYKEDTLMIKYLQYIIPMAIMVFIYFAGKLALESMVVVGYDVIQIVLVILGVVLGIIYYIYSRHFNLPTVKFSIVSLVAPLVIVGVVAVLCIVFSNDDPLFGKVEGVAYALMYLHMAIVNLSAICGYYVYAFVKNKRNSN
jgi:hypothetical protein